ncbi:ribonuclease P protein component [Sphingomonas changnyeongensis]|uniref:Ribonuclease P protein component n=2 Tax=Sphingomonas changnyeongensis TaxID=2698679 RepID=A0A7Z2S685_9SPHN|nr:ribonuclease P protein component [Sphingomonas changnyeongensis]
MVPAGQGEKAGQEKETGAHPAIGAGGAPVLTITRRADFLAANAGLRVPMPGFVLLVRPRGDGDPAMRLGITVTKKIGGAVVRNRMKRRFRALARQMLPTGGMAGADHVLIGRQGGVERAFDRLQSELAKALGRVARGEVAPDGGRRGPPRGRAR